MSPLPRELVRWIQTLDLPLTIKQPKRDLSNGYLFAEMCARYWPGFEMHSFENRLGRPNKEANWKVLRKYFAKNRFTVDEAVIEGVIDCVDGCAESLLFALYTALTKRELQMFPPTSEPEVEQVPVFNTMSSARQQQAQQQAQKSQEEAEKAAEMERKRLEAERLKAAQQRQQKPKTNMKAHAIEAAGEEEGGSSTGIKFATATVKPLPAQLFARFGMRGGESGAAASGVAAAASGGAGHVAGPTSGIIAILSTLISTSLQEANAAPFQLTSQFPTVADVFFRSLHTIEPSVRSVVWSALHQHIEELSERLSHRPHEAHAVVSLLQNLFGPSGLQNFLVAASIFQADSTNVQAQQALDTMNRALSWWISLFGLLYAGSPAVCQYILSTHVLPLLLPLRSASMTAETAEIIAQLLLPFTDCNAQTADATMPAFFSAVYDWLTNAPSTWDKEDPPNANVAARRGGLSRSGFLSFLAAFNRLVLRQIKTTRVAGDDGASLSAPLVEHELSVLHRTNQYHVTAGLAEAARSDRAAAMRLLAVLAENGAFTVLLEHYHNFVASFERLNAQWVRDSDCLLAFVRQTVALSKLLGSGSSRSATLVSGKLQSIAADVQRVVSVMAERLTDSHVLSRWKHRVAMLHCVLQHITQADAKLADDVVSYVVRLSNQPADAEEWQTVQALLFSASWEPSSSPTPLPQMVELHKSFVSGRTVLISSSSRVALVPLVQGATHCCTGFDVEGSLLPLSAALCRLVEEWRTVQAAQHSEGTPVRDLLLAASDDVAKVVPRAATAVLKLSESDAAAPPFHLLVTRLHWLRRVVLGSNQALVPAVSLSSERARKTLLAQLDGYYSDTNPSSSSGAAADDGEGQDSALILDGWWQVMKALGGYLNVGLYAAELLAGQLTTSQQHVPAPPKPGRAGASSTPAATVPPNALVQQGVFQMAACAQAVLVRWFTELSGNNTEHEDPQAMVTRAIEWFQNVVVSSR